VIRARAGSPQELDPRGEARQAERRRVETGDEGGGGAIALREGEGRGAEAAPDRGRRQGFRRRVRRRGRPGEA
jgi:hypothetical protein